MIITSFPIYRIQEDRLKNEKQIHETDEEEVLDKTAHGKENSPDTTGKSLFQKLHFSFLKSRVV